MISKNTFTFLSQLKKNNNRDWFEKNKQRYLDMKAEIEDFVTVMLKELSKSDPEYAKLKSKDCVFRIYRDTRFSKDKRPYKTNIGASINKGGKKASGPGYYLHIEPGGSGLAGGVWMPSGEELRKIRQEIDYNSKEIKKILNAKAFKDYFGGLESSYRVKTSPRGYDNDHPDIELIRLTSYITWHSFTDKEVMNPNFIKEVAKGAKVMRPLIQFLETALD